MNHHSFGQRPDGAVYYVCDGRFEFIAWSQPPATGDALCRSVTGRSEHQLVREILDGTYGCLGGRKHGE